MDLDILSQSCSGYTGADLAALIREAGEEVIKDLMKDPSLPLEINAKHLNTALNRIRPSISEKVR